MNRVLPSAFAPHSYSLQEVAGALGADHGHLVISTSGSTGDPKHVVLSAPAVKASAQAADGALAGPGQWILTLPTDHIAGVNVLVRSVVAGTAPVVLDRSVRFSQASFLAACASLTHPTRYVSLVPTQLHRLLEPGALYDETLSALSTFAGILVGGAATAPLLLEQARHAGLAVVTTYGMSETSGGCVYNASPLNGVAVAVDECGRISLGGAMIAEGYALDLAGPHDPACTRTHAFDENDPAFTSGPDGMRWHRTNDIGELDGQGRLRVLGRADDMILSGGLNISPTRIEAALAGHFGIAEALVVGIPDPEWGARVIALVTHGTEAIASASEIKNALAANLDKGHVPRAFYRVDQLPLTLSGKPDRRQAQHIAIAMSGESSSLGGNE